MDSSHTEQSLQAAGWKLRTLPGFIGAVGPLWTRRDGDSWAYGLLATSAHLNPVQLVHGGLLATLADHALSALAWEAVGRKPCVTVQLDTHYLASARAGQLLEARGRVVRVTSSLVFMQGQVSVGERELVTAVSVLKILSSDGPAG